MNKIIKEKQYQGLPFEEITDQFEIIQEIGFHQWYNCVEKGTIEIESENAKRFGFFLEETIEEIQNKAFYGSVLTKKVPLPKGLISVPLTI